MKISWLFIFFIMPTVVFAEISKDKSFAVVELFTSDGSSACLSADALVNKLTFWARKNHRAVYPLVFHVDYWNSRGWRDIFSSSDFTKRQYQYAEIFKDQGVYLPQMVVNGSDAFNGSSQDKLQKALNRELSIPSQMHLEISLRHDHQDLWVSYNALGQLNDDDLIVIVLLERNLSSDVTAGENAGRSLHHDNVVRELVTIPYNHHVSKTRLSLAKISDTTNASVVVFVQNRLTMLIEDAKELDVEND